MRSPGRAMFGRDVPDAAWRPSADDLEHSRLARFLRDSGEHSLDALQARAVADPGWFWGAAADDLAIPWQRRPTQVLDLSGGPEWSRWWNGGAFNYAVAAVEPRAARDPDGEAVAWEGEDGAVRRLTNHQLRTAIQEAVDRLHAQGVRPGDRVGLLLPMLIETVVVVLALGRLRAIYTPIFSGYGPAAIAARLADCGATMLITADGFLRRGAWVALKPVADEALDAAPSVRRVLVVRRAGDGLSTPMRGGRDAWWDDPLQTSAEAVHGPQDPAMAFDPDATTDPETPFLLIYTSGTTGRPKGAVHVHGGFPIKGAQDLAHQFDLGPGDALLWFTDLGWMMGPWAISGALLLGARLVIYEGAPDHPGPDRLWSMVARHRVTHLGLSPTLIRALMVHGEEPARAHDRSSLRVLGSTGEPWTPDAWWWYFRVIGEGRCTVINYSGGTEVSGGIVGGNLMTPVRATSFSGPCIGTAADVVDDSGRPVRGDVGELVIRAPLPGMSRGFWNDRDRYLDAYWRRIPGLWLHGDWARIDADGYWYILGRSDDTLKVAGKRIGPSEIESAATAHPAVLEAAAIGIPDPIKGEVIAVLVVFRPGVVGDPGLCAEIRSAVARQLGKAIQPAIVVGVPGLPKTRSGKIMRRVARAAYLGLDPGDLSTLDNPGIVAAIGSLRGR